jgi:hypothetical protein
MTVKLLACSRSFFKNVALNQIFFPIQLAYDSEVLQQMGKMGWWLLDSKFCLTRPINKSRSFTRNILETIKFKRNIKINIKTSVADPGCLSRILILTHPGSRIPDLGSRIQKQQQKRGAKKICCHTFFYSHKFHIIENILFLKCWRKKIWANFQRIIELFPQKIVTKLSKIWV